MTLKQDAAACMLGVQTAARQARAAAAGFVGGWHTAGSTLMTARGLAYALRCVADRLQETPAGSLCDPLETAASWVERDREAPPFFVVAPAAADPGPMPLARSLMTPIERAATAALGQEVGATVRIRTASANEAATFEGITKDTLRLQVLSTAGDDSEPVWCSAPEWADALRRALAQPERMDPQHGEVRKPRRMKGERRHGSAQ